MEQAIEVHENMSDDEIRDLADVLFQVLRKMEKPADAMTVITLMLINIFNNTQNSYDGSIEAFAERHREVLVDSYKDDKPQLQ